MTAISFSSEAVAALQELVDSSCSDLTRQLPYASAVVVDSTGGEAFVHTSGQRPGGRVANTDDVEGQSDDILWLASCTKLVTSIACLQLVEQGKLGLDDADQVEKLAPELRDVKVIQDDGSLTNKQKRITLRMLLTHTAGFGYSFLHPNLKKHRIDHCGEKENYNEMSGEFKDMLQPLVNQPGEKFEYGISLDWAGILVERVTDSKLGDYMTQHIFQPLQIADLAMIPSPDFKRRLVGLWQRGEDGRLRLGKYPTLTSLDDVDAGGSFHSGGAGLFGSIREYSKILSTLLNDGTSPLTGASILRPETVSQLFTNQLSDWPNFGRRHLPAVKPELVYPAEGFYPLCPPSLAQGWGLGSMISPGMTGRSDTTAHWSGLSNVFWWIDHEKGVAGVVASQILPFADPQTVMLWASVEGKVYEELTKKQR